jgi:hypothetical protein
MDNKVTMTLNSQIDEQANNPPTIYTIGYQPIEIIGRDYRLVDLVNLITDKWDVTGNVYDAVIEYVKKFQLRPEDKYFLNTKKNSQVIPYIWENLNRFDSLKQLLIYDPSYVASDAEIYKILKDLKLVIGPKQGYRSYIDAANAVKETVVRVKDNMSQKDYFNALMLLSDLNKSSVDALIQYLLSFTQPYQMNMTKKVIFFGDPVTPRYFEYLNSQGIFVVSFLPYEFFLTPCMTPEQYYFENPMYQSHLFTLIELRRLITIYMPDALILNPGGLYLTPGDAKFFAYELQNDVKIKILSGNYPGEQISI